jgi:predicted glutamine amidotransferase
MCIAILCPQGTQITAQQFQNSWDNNYNGAGFMYNDDNNKLHVVKEMEDCDKLYKKYVKLVSKYPNATFVLHFRISNRGVINRENCHPFKVSNELAFVHNGTITSVDKDDKRSDTNIFNRQILRKLPNADIKFLNNSAVKGVLEEFIGYSKIIFLDNNGQYALLNENDGYWEEGIWYSNDSHDTVSDYVDMGGTRVHRSRINPDGTLKPEKTYGGYGGYGSGSSSVGYRSQNYYGRGWNWEDDYDWSDKSTTNSKVKETSKELDLTGTEANYQIADGSEKCKCCEAEIGKYEILSVDGECMECVSEMEAIAITEAVVNDGYILHDFSDGSVRAEREESAECDGCLETNKVSSLKYVSGWQCSLCPKCMDDMKKEGLIDDEYLDGSCVATCGKDEEEL